MPIYVLYLTLSCMLPWQCTQKERRQIAQKTRDQLKNRFNASIKLDYAKENTRFTLYFVMLGESRDYLLTQIEALHDQMDISGDFHYELDTFIEPW